MGMNSHGPRFKFGGQEFGDQDFGFGGAPDFMTEPMNPMGMQMAYANALRQPRGFGGGGAASPPPPPPAAPYAEGRFDPRLRTPFDYSRLESRNLAGSPGQPPPLKGVTAQGVRTDDQVLREARAAGYTGSDPAAARHYYYSKFGTHLP